MKFVCDRCQTRYSIADEKVRQKILRIRCKTCGNVIVVQDEHLRGSPVPEGHAAEPVPSTSSGPKTAPASGPKPPPIPTRIPSSGPQAPPAFRAAKGPDRLGGHTEWYLAIDGEQSGPFSRSEVAKRIQAAGPGKSAHVWKEGMAAWKPPQEVSVVAHELALLRPSPPPRPAVVPSAPIAESDSEVTTTPLPLAGAASPRIAEAAPAEITVPEVSSAFSDITTKKGKELAANPARDDFGESTTKKTKDLREMVVAAPSAASYTEATTKKGKNLHELEADVPTAPGVDLGEPDRTPPPMKPLPPVGAKVASPVPLAVRRPPALPDPVVSFETPPPTSPARPSASFMIPGTPLPPPAPGFRLPSSPPLAGGLAFPVAPMAVAPSGPSAPFAAAAVAAPGTPFPIPSVPHGPLLVPGDLPTPRPVPVASSGGAAAGLGPSEVQPAPGRIAGLFQRQPGLKYLVAALAIVALIILLGLVILRGGERAKGSEPVTPAAEPEPPSAEEPKLAIAETPPPPPRTPQEKPAPVAPPTGKSGAGPSGRAARRGAAAERRAPERPTPERPAPERPAKDNPSASPPRLAGGARPNPFDDSRSVSQAQITAVVRNPANQVALKSCYERALKMDNHLTSGRIDVTVSIAASGGVERVVINAPSSFILVEPCIKSAVKRWSFPPNVEDYATTFPLIMQGGM